MAMTVRAILLDISGVLYEGDQAVSGAVEAVRSLRQAGLPLRLVTNTSRRTEAALLDHLRGFGFEVESEDVFTATKAVVTHLTREDLRPYLLVHPNLETEFAELARDDPNAVVVGDAGDRFTYDRLNAAFRLLADGAPLLAIAANRYFRDTDGLSLDAGPFVAALECAADTQATVFGKPAPAFFETVLADLGTKPEETLMIGDDVEADVNGALAFGLQAALVRTGKFQSGDEDRVEAGGRCVADLREAVRDLVGA